MKLLNYIKLSLLNSLVILSILSAIGCSSYSNSTSNDKPSWVRTRPQSSDYYIGIGIANHTGNIEEDLRRATENAHNNLAASLRVQIESSSENIVMESREISIDIMNYHIKSSVDMVLEDVEVVDSWSSDAKKQGYWVYVRLSKRLLEEKARIKKENAKTLAKSNYQRGNESLSAGMIGSALSSFVEGYANIIEYLNEPLNIIVNGRPMVLNSALTQSIKEVLSGLKLTALNESAIEGKYQQPLSTPLTVKLDFKNTNLSHSISGIPVAFDPIDIKMDLQTSVTTKSDNTAQSTVYRLTDEKDVQYVIAKIDLNKIVSGLTEDSELENIILNSLSNLPNPSVTFKINVANILMIDRYEFDSNVSDNALNIIKESVRDGLTRSLGIAFTDNPAGSNFSLDVKGISESLPANEFGIYFSYISYTFTLKDNQTNEVIYSSVMNRVKGAGLSESLALNKAIINGTTKFKTELLKELTSVIEKL